MNPFDAARQDQNYLNADSKEQIFAWYHKHKDAVADALRICDKLDRAKKSGHEYIQLTN